MVRIEQLKNLIIEQLHLTQDPDLLDLVLKLLLAESH